MIILAVVIILSISNSGIIGRSNEALGEGAEITIDKLSSTKGYQNKFTVQNGELRYLREGDLTKEEIAWAKEVGVKSTAIELVDGQNGVTISEDGELSIDKNIFTLKEIISK